MKRLIDESEIRERVAGLGKQIVEDYNKGPLTVLGVLTGSIVFLADLIRAVDLPIQVGLIQASSYRGTATRPGELAVSAELLPDVSGQDVLLVDDIFDTGHTLATLCDLIRKRQPRSLRSAVLLWKEGRSEVEIEPDYHCFQIPDVFVVGYGLDYNNQYRHLPYIAALEPDDLQG